MAEYIPQLMDIGGAGLALGWLAGFMAWDIIVLFHVINKFK